MSLSSRHVVEMLRAAGEATRFRILTLLTREELAVAELTRVLDQSQPRVSRHLKLLVAAGLVERFPDGAWVFYRLATHGIERAFIDQILAIVEGDDAAIARDPRRWKRCGPNAPRRRPTISRATPPIGMNCARSMSPRPTWKRRSWRRPA